jgi:hypothetical protein
VESKKWNELVFIYSGGTQGKVFIYLKGIDGTTTLGFLNGKQWKLYNIRT